MLIAQGWQHRSRAFPVIGLASHQPHEPHGNCYPEPNCCVHIHFISPIYSDANAAIERLTAAGKSLRHNINSKACVTADVRGR